MVLVAVAIGTGWVYSVAATFWIEGDVFYEAAAFLAACGGTSSSSGAKLVRTEPPRSGHLVLGTYCTRAEQPSW